MSSKLILLNGPMECGKNVAVDYIKGYFSKQIVDRRCKDHLFELTAKFFRMEMSTFSSYYENREYKETPMEAFAVSAERYNQLMIVLGKPTINAQLLDRSVKLSVREALILVSEVLTKPTFGKEYFGDARAMSMMLSEDEWAIDDSCGFADEIGPSMDALGQSNIMLIRIYGRGEFNANDSRGYIPEGVVHNTVDVYNDGTEQKFLGCILDLANEFYMKGL